LRQLSPRLAIDDQRVDAELRQAGRDRQSGVSAPNHKHRRVAIGIDGR
jgi:hypothetical protein